MRAVIIGAGIGGLAAAVALRRVGVPSLMVERADSIREIGAGLSLWSNAVNALRELGVESQVMNSASIIQRNSVRTPAGRLLATTDFADLSRNAGAPCICVHRAVLQRLLLEELPPASVMTGARCVGFNESAAILDDGQQIKADFLVGADGISSVIRAALHAPEPPRYAGYTCWRGMLRSEGVLPFGSAWLLVAGAGSQFGLWASVGRDIALLVPDTKRAARRAGGEIGRFNPGSAIGQTPIPGIVEATPEDAIVQHDIVDRPPLRHWGRGHITLLGDAAHATTPNLGQGACMALEDAVVLAHCIATHYIANVRPIESALREYERRCAFPRTAAIVRESWQTGRVLQLDRPALESVRDRFIASSLGRHLGMRTFTKLTDLQGARPAGT